MNELRIFNNADFGDIRTVEQDGGIWFVGKDVAEALGYSNPSNAVISHVDDEDKLRTQIKYAGQNREVSIINESGLYSLVLSSKLPKAKAFKRWITSEVIPSIRKTGSYNKPSKQPTTQQEQRAKAMLLNAQSRQCKLWLRLAETTDLPVEQRELVEQIEYNLDIADQCFSTIKAMLPDKEVVLMMLMDKYAESMHSQMQAKEELEKAGYSEVQILNLRQGYCDE